MPDTLALSLQPLISQLTSLRLDSSLLDPSLLVMLVTGLGVGVVAAVLGIGGGLIMVPVLTLSGASPVQAVATSLLGVLFGAASGTLHNLRSGNLKLVHVALLAPAAVVTTEFGVALANAAPPRALLVAFAALLLSAIWLIHLKNRLSARTAAHTAANIAANPDAAPYAPPKATDEAFVFRGTGIGALAGVLAGLFGVGGGVVMVPLQLLYLGESIKEAVRTSLGVVALVAVWALGRHALAGNVLWPEGVALGLGSLVGAQFGARLLSALPDALVNLLFRVLLLALAAYMLFEAARWS